MHSSIPLAARTVEELGKKTGAWSTTITYDPADINAQNLKQYDAIFLDSTTGAFLDDPNDQAATDARRKALLEFVRGGKGLAGIHAATDSYHRRDTPAAPAGRQCPRPASAAAGASADAAAPATTLAPVMFAQGDTNDDQKLSRAEMTTLADTWFDKIDPQKTGSREPGGLRDALRRRCCRARRARPRLLPRPPRPAQTGPDGQVGTGPSSTR